MVLRWVAAAFLQTEKNFRRIQSFRDLWMLKAKLESEVALESNGECDRAGALGIVPGHVEIAAEIQRAQIEDR